MTAFKLLLKLYATRVSDSPVIHTLYAFLTVQWHAKIKTWTKTIYLFIALGGIRGSNNYCTGFVNQSRKKSQKYE